MKSKKLFVGGYYNQRIFKGEVFDGKTPFNTDVCIYTLEEVLELGFIDKDYLIEWYELNEEKKWDDATEKEKTKAVLDYTEGDEIAGLEYCDSEKEAEDYKNYILEDIKECEEKSEYFGTIQDQYGYFREVYVEKIEV